MGYHTYDLWDGLTGHLPWPPPRQGDGVRAGLGAPVTAVDKSRHGIDRHRRLQNRRRAVGSRGLGLGSPHSDLDWSADPAGSFTEPLYFSIAINATLSLLDMFATRGTPVRYINLDYDELRAVARDSRELLSGKTNGQLLAESINKVRMLSFCSSSDFNT